MGRKGVSGGGMGVGEEGVFFCGCFFLLKNNAIVKELFFIFAFVFFLFL